MTTDDSSQNSNDGTGDDLTAIKGIGPARQQWLIKVFDVRTFSTLAALSVDQIEAALKAEKRLMVARPEIHEWIVQARELAAASDLASQQEAEPAAAKAEGASNAPTTLEWKPFASFVVELRERTREGQAEEYQTSVHHVEADKSETWPGLDGEALCEWMLAQVHREALPETEEPERAEEPEEEPAEAVSAERPPTAESDIAIQVTQIQIRQPTGAEKPAYTVRHDQIFSGFVRSAEPFALEVSFQLVGSATTDIAKKEIPFFCQFYVRNLATGASLHLGNSMPSTLVEGQSSYTATLHSANLPEGAYRMQTLVLVQNTPPIPGFMEVPILQVF